MPFNDELAQRAATALRTPERLVLDGTARERVARIGSAARGSRDGPRLQPAYSVKTNPRPAFLELALAEGFVAEVISPDEAAAARRAGFTDGAILYNGPRAFRRTPAGEPLYAAFADSVEALHLYASESLAMTTGVRLRPHGIPSRFGVPESEFDRAAAELRALPRKARAGASMHVRSEDYRPRTWLELASDFIDLAGRLQTAAQRRLQLLDVGGGWTPQELDVAFTHDFPALQRLVSERLPEVDTIVFEPGQSLLTECEALVCAVIEVRSLRGELVVDAGFSELPHLRSYPHRLYWLRDGVLEPIERGTGRILGPLCLEYDVLASDVRLHRDVTTGDRIVVADCGSYDASMAFTFARGATGAAVPAT